LYEPDVDRAAQQDFLQREVTFTDGSSGRRAAEYFLSLLPEARS
jgi:hypothetical protein